MNDRIVVITGATGGLGQTVTRRWLEAGAKVVAVGSRPESLDALGGHERLATMAADLARAEGALDVVRFARGAFGAPDTLLHLAGGFAMGPTEDEGAVAIWQRMMRVNVETALHAYRAVIPAMRERGGGSIVGISSRAARSPGAQIGAYAASKAALEALSRSLAEELRPDQIRVNLIATSTIDTPANRAAMGGSSKWVTPDQLADAALFLASDAASAITGTVMDVFGDA